jgi:hypothetical protein
MFKPPAQGPGARPRARGGAGTSSPLIAEPVVRRQNEGIALGYVAGRVVEAVVIVVGIISLLSVVTLRQDLAGAAGANGARAGVRVGIGRGDPGVRLGDESGRLAHR